MERGDERSAGACFLHGDVQIGDQAKLHDVTGGAGLPGGDDELFVVVDCKEYDGRCEACVAKIGGNLQTRHTRHRNVEDDNVRPQRLCGVDSGRSVFHCPDNHAIPGQHGGRAGEHRVTIVYEQDARRLR